MQRFVQELVCDKIREERKKRGLKSKDMAELLFKDPSSYSRMERGEGIAVIDNLDLVANVLGIDVRELFDVGIVGNPKKKNNDLQIESGHRED